MTAKKKKLNADESLQKLARAADGRLPHLAEIAEELLKGFGGAAGFADEFHKIRLNEKTTSSTRGRMMQDYIRILIAAHGGGENRDPLEQMTDEELRAAVRDIAGDEDDGTTDTAPAGEQ
jgi:hypothetical protein